MKYLLSVLFLLVSVMNSFAQESAWRYVFSGVRGYEGQFFRGQRYFRTNSIPNHPAFQGLEPGLHLRIYEEPQRYVNEPNAGGVYIKTALLNNTSDTVYLYKIGNLEGITTEIKKGDEWVEFQKIRALEDHLEYLPVIPGHYVDIYIQLKVSGKVKVPYRLRLVTTKSVVFSNEILINCSKAQFQAAGMPFPY